MRSAQQHTGPARPSHLDALPLIICCRTRRLHHLLLLGALPARAGSRAAFFLGHPHLASRCCWGLALCRCYSVCTRTGICSDRTQPLGLPAGTRHGMSGLLPVQGSCRQGPHVVRAYDLVQEDTACRPVCNGHGGGRAASASLCRDQRVMSCDILSALSVQWPWDAPVHVANKRPRLLID